MWTRVGSGSIVKMVSKYIESTYLHVSIYLSIYREWTNVDRAILTFYFKNSENIFLSFKKFRIFFLDIANDGIYEHAKSQCEILSTLGYTKMTNL
jgi:hypothetical protein